MSLLWSNIHSTCTNVLQNVGKLHTFEQDEEYHIQFTSIVSFQCPLIWLRFDSMHNDGSKLCNSIQFNPGH